jgi:hypothetical protein
MMKIRSELLTPVLFAACLIGALLLVAGCGSKAGKLTTDQVKAFDSAPPETKQAWDKALAAEKAKDYVAAQTEFASLGQMILSDEQRKILDDERAVFGQRLTQAADKDDPAAVQALQMAIKSRNAR